MKNLNQLRNDSSVLNQKCCLCGTKFNEFEFGNNPSPLMKKDGEKCCDECNVNLVIESRILLYSLSKQEQKKCTTPKGWLRNVNGTIQFIKTIKNMRR